MKTLRETIDLLLAEAVSKKDYSTRPWSEVDKSKLPKSCFLIVGDPKLKSTWKLPYREGAGGIDPETGMYRKAGPVNLNALRAILAAIGGARTGKPMSVPRDVMRKIKRLCRRYGIGQYAEEESKNEAVELGFPLVGESEIDEAYHDLQELCSDKVAALARQAKKRGLKPGSSRYNRYVYGTLKSMGR